MSHGTKIIAAVIVAAAMILVSGFLSYYRVGPGSSPTQYDAAPVHFGVVDRLDRSEARLSLLEHEVAMLRIDHDESNDAADEQRTIEDIEAVLHRRGIETPDHSLASEILEAARETIPICVDVD